MDNYKVYVHINKVNGKRYYGITKLKVEKRWNYGYGYKGQYFYRAIEKYCWENFEHIVIARGLTEEEAKWLEIELIREFDTTNPEYGYNRSLGGESYNCSEETRKKISETRKAKKHSEARRGVYCVELDMYFNTETKASKFVGCHKNSISRVLTGRTKTAGGYHWLYAKEVNEENINKVLSEEYNNIDKGEPTKIKLDKYFDSIAEGVNEEIDEEDIDNIIIQEKVYCVELDKYFDNVIEASEYVGCYVSSILELLKGNCQTAGGYHWLRAEDVKLENNKVS